MAEINDNVKGNIKQNIRLLREANNLKMRDVANALGIKENTYRVWEDTNKISLPKLDSVVELAKIFNVSADFILRSESSNSERIKTCVSSCSDADSIYGDKYLNELSAYEKIVIMKIRRMSSSDKKRVEELIEDILGDSE